MAANTEKKKSWTKEIILGGIILLAIAAIIAVSMRGDDGEDAGEATDAAYSQGYYDYAYELLDDTWYSSRLLLTRATLVANTCSDDSEGRACDYLKDERDKLSARELPGRLTEGSEFDFDSEVISTNVELSQLNASMRYVENHIGTIEEELDRTISAKIGETVAQAGRAKFAIIDAEEHLADNPDDTAVRDAKEALEAVLAEHETGEVRSDWGIIELERAFDELDEATARLTAALPDA